MQQNNQVIYRNDKIFHNGELWNVINIEANGEKDVEFSLEHTARGETDHIIVGAQDIKFID
jgi:hypothetical protein